MVDNKVDNNNEVENNNIPTPADIKQTVSEEKIVDGEEQNSETLSDTVAGEGENPKTQEKKVVSQATVNKRFGKERAKFREELQTYKTQLDEQKKKIEELEKSLETSTADNNRFKIGSKYKLDNELISVLPQTDNVEEIERTAKILSERTSKNSGVVIQEGTNQVQDKSDPIKEFLDLAQ